MTNQPKRKKKRSLVRTLLYRFFTGLEILIKFCFFIPILLFIVWFSHKVDISGLFQGELAPREVANMLLAGDTVSNYDKLDERAVLELYVQNLPEEQVPETIALGSSRVLQLQQELVGGSFFNMGLSGASAMDVMNCFYLLDKEGKLPKNLIIEVDPWLFNGENPTLNQQADTELFPEFLQNALGIESDYQEPDKLELWKALIDPAYFQGNVKYALKQRATGETTTEDGESIPFQPVSGDLDQLEYNAKAPDGTVVYQADFRNWNYDQVMAEVLDQAGTLNGLHGFSQMDPYWTDLFERFVSYVQSKDVNVVLLLTPYHPFIIKYVHDNPQGFDGFFDVEPWLRSFAQEHNIPLYGSYHASRIGVPESLFYDGLHCKPEALKLYFPGIEAALQGLQTFYEAQYLETYGADNADLVTNALVGTTADCLVVDEEWFAKASAA